MVNAIVGIVIVAGACIALWWHSGVRDALLKEARDDRDREFLHKQHQRRSITTTLLGLLGLSILATEANPTLWGDAALLVAMLVLVIAIFARAWSDMLATGRHYQRNDQGARQSKAALEKELLEIQQRLASQRRASREASSQDTPSPTDTASTANTVTAAKTDSPSTEDSPSKASPSTDTAFLSRDDNKRDAT